VTPPARVRQWAATAAVTSQLAATAAGMLPWWSLPLTIVLTVILAREPGPVQAHRPNTTRNLAIGAVAIFTSVIVVKTVSAAGSGADPIATLRSLTEALVTLALIIASSARTPREQRVWLTVITGVLVAAAAGGHSVLSRSLAALSWVTLLVAMVRVQSAAVFADNAVVAVTVGHRDRGNRRRSTSGIVPVTAALVAGILVFFALPSGLGGGGLARRVVHHVASSDTTQQASRSIVGVDTDGGSELSLLVRGQLPDTPLLRVPRRSPALWRGTFFDTYTGSSWVAVSDDGFAYTRGNSVALAPEVNDPRPVGHTRTDHATYASPIHGSLVWSPGVPLRVTGVGGQLNGVSTGHYNVRAIGSQSLSGYDVTAAVATTSPTRLAQAQGPDQVAATWTALPAELPARVGALAHQITAHAANRYSAVTDLETYLRTHETYSTSSPIPGAGQDAVDEFLFRDHTGFCEQFASAEAVMLRTLGIPSRLVTGLAYGHPDGSTRLYTAADAHAWVEVYYPGIGWSPTDPTAGAVLAAPTSAKQSLTARALKRLAADLPGGRFTLLGIAVLLLIVGAMIVRVFVSDRIARARAGETDDDRSGPVLTAFARLAAGGGARPPRAGTETPGNSSAGSPPPVGSTPRSPFSSKNATATPRRAMPRPNVPSPTSRATLTRVRQRHEQRWTP
jgi:transglutaminase-like putative cysteine protease